MNDDKIIIYTDGACSGNPGMGGWGAVLMYKGSVKEISGFSKDTTNNKMELTATIEALKSLKVDSIKSSETKISIYTDSTYVKNGITKWVFNWKKNNWKVAETKHIQNLELWKTLDSLANGVYNGVISWYWVKGHSGDKWNEVADRLATGEIEKNKII